MGDRGPPESKDGFPRYCRTGGDATCDGGRLLQGGGWWSVATSQGKTEGTGKVAGNPASSLKDRSPPGSPERGDFYNLKGEPGAVPLKVCTAARDLWAALPSEWPVGSSVSFNTILS